MDEQYNVADILDKTLIAAKDIPVYAYSSTAQGAIAYVKRGDPVGIVRAWIQPSGTDTDRRLWWQFWPATNYSSVYYAPHEEGMYDISALREQGVLSQKEKLEEEEEKDLPWYERLIKRYGIWVVIAILGSAAISGYLGKKK